MIANELRSYREVIAEALRASRPDVDFVIVEPERLSEVVSRLVPEMVICDEADANVRENALVWLELYPQQSARSVVDFAGERSTIENIQLSDILAFVDRAVELARGSSSV